MLVLLSSQRLYTHVCTRGVHTLRYHIATNIATRAVGILDHLEKVLFSVVFW